MKHTKFNVLNTRYSHITVHGAVLKLQDNADLMLTDDNVDMLKHLGLTVELVKPVKRKAPRKGSTVEQVESDDEPVPVGDANV